MNHRDILFNNLPPYLAALAIFRMADEYPAPDKVAQFLNRGEQKLGVIGAMFGWALTVEGSDFWLSVHHYMGDRHIVDSPPGMPEISKKWVDDCLTRKDWRDLLGDYIKLFEKEASSGEKPSDSPPITLQKLLEIENMLMLVNDACREASVEFARTARAIDQRIEDGEPLSEWKVRVLEQDVNLGLARSNIAAIRMRISDIKYRDYNI